MSKDMRSGARFGFEDRRNIGLDDLQNFGEGKLVVEDGDTELSQVKFSLTI